MSAPQEQRIGPAASLRPASRAFLRARPSSERKRLGQFLTPAQVRERLLDRVPLWPGMRVLDPGAGTGEFLLDARERCEGLRLHGYEVDPALVAACRSQGLGFVERRDFLREPPPDGSFDLVFGNPPYYEVPHERDLRARYAEVLRGRPNVFSMFVMAGVEALATDGVLAFVVPPSMNNGRFFEPLRRYLLERGAIEAIDVLDDPGLFEDALQSVQILVFRKGARHDRHVFRARFGDEVVPLFVSDPGRLSSLLRGFETLAGLGLRVRTGRCVWNQRRDDLRWREERGAVRLIWARDIGRGSLEFDSGSGDRAPYVRFDEPDRGPAIVVNRITGRVGQGALRAAVVPSGLEFVGENHVNVVLRPGGPREGDEALFARVVEGLCSERALQAVRCLTGNTQLSSRELAHLVPVLEKNAGRTEAGA